MLGKRSTSLLALFSWNNPACCRRLTVTNVDHWISGFDKQSGKLLSAINRSFDIEEVREYTFITHVLKWAKKEIISVKTIGHVTPVNVTQSTSELCIGRPATGSDLGIEVSSPRHRRSTVIVCSTS